MPRPTAARRLLSRQATNTLLNASASMRRRSKSADQPLAAAMRACASADRPLGRSAGRGGGCSGAGCDAAVAAGALLQRHEAISAHRKSWQSGSGLALRALAVVALPPCLMRNCKHAFVGKEPVCKAKLCHSSMEGQAGALSSAFVRMQGACVNRWPGVKQAKNNDSGPVCALCGPRHVL